MKKQLLLIICFLTIGFCSCSPKVHKHIVKDMSPLANNSEVTVYNSSSLVPKNAVVIGDVAILDGGTTTKCDWETVIETAKQEAREAGGNGLEILQHSKPGENGSSCHQIVAYILNISDENEPVELSEMAKENFHDYVVMKDGDTIPCIVMDKTNNHIGFVYERNGVRRFSVISTNDLQSFYINDPVEMTHRKEESQKKEFNVQIALNGGYAFRTAPFPKDMSNDYKEYLKKLSHGLDLGASVRLNLSRGLTLGLHYDRFSKGLQATGYAYDNEGNYYEGTISNWHTITFVGTSLGMLSSSSRNQKHFLNVELLLGYLGYEDKAEEFDQSYTLSGRTLGYGIGFGYDYKITKSIALGAEVSYIGGALSKVRYFDGVHPVQTIDLGKSKEGLQRINLKAGIRFYL